jgi:hypothetical protein
MKRLILAVLLIATPLLAQVPPPAAQERSTKLITLKYVDPQNIINILRTFGVEIQFNRELKVMSVNGPAQNVAAMEAALKQLDVAPKNIELVVYFVVAGNQPPAVANNLPAVPAELRDVIAQLKSTFAFKEYSMLDTLTLRTRAGSSAETTGILSPPTTTRPRLSLFSIRNATVGDDGTIRLDRMHAGLRIPIPTQSNMEYLTTGIDQDVDVKEGQKIVVGRASLEGPEKALFLILTAKVVQ